jgi:hypothetical protein
VWQHGVRRRLDAKLDSQGCHPGGGRRNKSATKERTFPHRRAWARASLPGPSSSTPHVIPAIASRLPRAARCHGARLRSTSVALTAALRGWHGKTSTQRPPQRFSTPSHRHIAGRVSHDCSLHAVSRGSIGAVRARTTSSGTSSWKKRIDGLNEGARVRSRTRGCGSRAYMVSTGFPSCARGSRGEDPAVAAADAVRHEPPVTDRRRGVAP